IHSKHLAHSQIRSPQPPDSQPLIHSFEKKGVGTQTFPIRESQNAATAPKTSTQHHPAPAAARSSTQRQSAGQTLADAPPQSATPNGTAATSPPPPAPAHTAPHPNTADRCTRDRTSHQVSQPTFRAREPRPSPVPRRRSESRATQGSA